MKQIPQKDEQVILANTQYKINTHRHASFPHKCIPSAVESGEKICTTMCVCARDITKAFKPLCFIT